MMKEDVLPEGWEKTKLGKYLKRIHIAHATKYEKELCNIWKEVLELK